MADDPDHYESHYSNKLWNLLPTIYRAEDTREAGQDGPLREMVNRIGAQAAVVRRSLDRLWEDQSIETCDEWVIAYIGGLLGTNLVESLDGRGQRLDVANTIDYRRRKGTVALVEKLAADITGWDARAVEFFRRMTRTRHNLDPEPGPPFAPEDPAGDLQRVQGLRGARTRTCSGGWADLRSIDGASLTNSAFDEYAHSADVRTGMGASGRYNIESLGVFLWRLRSCPVGPTTPVEDAERPGQYTFDPTGRDIPLFAAASRSYDDEWVSPEEWQLPAPITRAVLSRHLGDLYTAAASDGDSVESANSLGVFRLEGPSFRLITKERVGAAGDGKNREFKIDPERGRLILRDPSPVSRFRTLYHYGSVSDIGAGSYDRRSRPAARPRGNPESVSAFAAALPPTLTVSVEGGGDLTSALVQIDGVERYGVIRIDDSLTYGAIYNMEEVRQAVIQANNHQRPLIRLPLEDGAPMHWIFTGAGNDSALTLDGLFVSGGGDIILRGTFDRVTLNCCTLDPGSAGETPRRYALSADDRELRPTRLRIEGQVRHLTIDRCITGPIETTGAGEVEALVVTDSIVQSVHRDSARGDLAIRTHGGKVELLRCTLLGPAVVHRLTASDCILEDIVRVHNTQSGCVRYSAWSEGSVLPGQFASVMVSARPPLFTSIHFGDPAYAQLSQSVDISISQGAENGSEMGAYAREKVSIKERSLRIKFEEFLPLGLKPVILYVT